MNKEQQESLNPYKTKFERKNRQTQKFDHNSRQKKVNNSLPSISFGKTQKVNAIRGQINNTKDQIVLLKARITSLKSQRDKNEKKKMKNEKQVEFIQTIRERLYQQKMHKKKIEEQRQKQLEMLKQQASQFRQEIIRNKEVSKSIVKQKKVEMGQQERKKRKDDEDYIKAVKNIEMQENRLKAKCVKQEQVQIQEKMKMFNNSRIIFAKQNHKNKVDENLKQKKKVQKYLHKLKEEEGEIIQEFKKSQANMVKSIRDLESLNVEKKKKGPQSSKTSSIKYY